MLVPQNRLIFWTAAVLLPASIAALMGDEGFIGASIAAGLFFCAALVDALLASPRLRKVRLSLPPLVRLQQRRSGSLELMIETRPGAPDQVRAGLGFPQDLGCPDLDQWIALPPEPGHAKAVAACTPLRRGSYRLREIYVEVRSPLGLWGARGAQAIDCELRVYPNLAEERRRVSALFLRRANSGVHVQRFAGQGREFEKLRDYIHGDSVSDIHWKASGKRNKPVTKVFQIERSHEVYVIVDASRLSARKASSADGAGAVTCLERYVSAALLLGLAAEQQGDQFGLITFSDRVVNFVRARTGKAHFDACRDQLYGLHSENVSPNFEELCTFIRLRLRKRALLIFLTHLDDPVLAATFSKGIELISRQHLVLVNMIVREGVRPLFSEEAAPVETDDLYGELAGHLQWHALRELQTTLRRRGVRLSSVSSETVAADVISQHAEMRARQLI